MSTDKKKEVYSLKGNRIIAMLICITVLLTGFPSSLYSNNDSYAAVINENVTRTYYHLDLGVQVLEKYIKKDGAGNTITEWYNNIEYGYEHPGPLSFTLNIGRDAGKTFNLVKVYSYRDFKGKLEMDSSNSIVSHNLNVNTQSEFDNKYNAYMSETMHCNNYSASGRSVSFSYSAKMKTDSNLELYSYFENGGTPDKIYDLFNSKAELMANYPKIANAIESAKNNAGKAAYAGWETYLVFCPSVIEYTITKEEEVEIGELEARLNAPSSVKQGESFNVEDASIVDDSITVTKAELECKVDDGAYGIQAIWNGTGIAGENTGQSIEQSFTDVCTVTYKLTIYGDKGEKSSCEKTVIVEDRTLIDGNAKLDLPKFTYEGHIVTANDDSTFEVDGVFYSADRAYVEKVATNRFSIKANGVGNINKKYRTRADLSFHKVGTFPVELRVDLKNGTRLTDTKYIEVKKTPVINDMLQGVQKQNRKQIISANIITNPNYPLSEVYIKVSEKGGGNPVTLYHNTGETNTLNNSSMIKTRAIKDNGSDEYFTNISLEFLTKNAAEKEFTYTIYAKDSRGNVDTVTKDFTVVEDKAPIAKILTPTTHIREQGENYAYVKAEDVSETEGDDLERTWYIKDDETGVYTDASLLNDVSNISFGTNKAIQWKKNNGVGKVYFKLDIKEVWAEETLEEYITENDYLTASTTGFTEVVNIAPTVSLDPMSVKNIKLNIFSNDKAIGTDLENKLENIRNNLLGEGTYIQTKLYQVENENENRMTIMFSHDEKSMYEGRSRKTRIEESFFSIDDKYLFTLNSAYQQGELWGNTVYNPVYPLVLRCYDIENGKLLKWAKTITKDMLNNENIESISMYHEDSGKYLLLTTSEKTYIIDKESGGMLATINLRVGTGNYAEGEYLYSVTDTGLYQINTQTGLVVQIIKMNVIHGSDIENSRKINNKIIFFGKNSSLENIKKVEYDLNEHEKNYYDVDIISNDVKVAGIDVCGKYAIIYNKSINVYNENNVLIWKNTINTSSSTEETNYKVAWKTDDTFDYIVSSKYDTISSSKYYNIHTYVNCFSIYTNEVIEYHYERQLSSSADSDFGSVISPKFAFRAFQLDDKVYFMTGHECYDEVSVVVPIHSYHQNKSTITIFDLKQKNSVFHLYYNHGYSDTTLPFGISQPYLGCIEYLKLSNKYLAFAVVPDYAENADKGDYSTFKRVIVVKRPQNFEENLFKGINKNVGIVNSASDKNILILAGKEETASKNEVINDISRTIFDNNTELVTIRTTGNGNIFTLISNKIASLGGKIRSLVYDSALEKEIEEVLTDEITQENSMEIISQNQKKGEISKTVELKPFKEYFYEYSIENEDGVENSNTDSFDILYHNKIGSIVNPNGYYVTESIVENFNSKKSGFFTYSHEPEFTLDGIEFREKSSSLYMKRSISFIIPEGKKAILEVEGMNFYRDGNILTASNVNAYLDNNYLENGLYRNILDEGNHTLSFTLGQEGYLNSKTTEKLIRIKKIAIHYIEAHNADILLYDTNSNLNTDIIYNISDEGIYNIKLYGPCSNDGNEGGIVMGTAHLKKGDIITGYLGPCTPIQSIEGADGISGNGYGDNGKYKATVSINGNIAMVAGGAGSNGAKGVGNNNRLYEKRIYNSFTNVPCCIYCNSENIYIDSGRYRCKNCNRRFTSPYTKKVYDTCIECGNSNSSHYHYYYEGMGGVGGKGAIGGDTSVTFGSDGTVGSEAHNNDSYIYTAGGNGGKGGNGGSSYVDASIITNSNITKGSSGIVSRIVICKRDTPYTPQSSIKKTEEKITDNKKTVTGSFMTPPEIKDFVFKPAEVYIGESFDDLNALKFMSINNTNHSKGNMYTFSSIDTGYQYLFSKITMNVNKRVTTENYNAYTIDSERYMIMSDHVSIGKSNLSSFNLISNINGKYTEDRTPHALKNYMFVKLPPNEITPQMNAKQYFVGSLGIYQANTVYDDKATITLKNNADKWYLKSFSLWYEENGKRIYVINDKQITEKTVSAWEVLNGSKKLVKELHSSEKDDDESSIIIYKKRQPVAHYVNYSDYENDPELEKNRRWIYAHTPYNDGEHYNAAIVFNDQGQIIKVCGISVSTATTIEQALTMIKQNGSNRYILKEHIPSFDVDGKYQVFFYTKDDTSRGKNLDGNPTYDKESNYAEITFYVMGEGIAPYVESITTNPDEPKEGSHISLKIKVNDADKDVLHVYTEVYRDGKKIYTHSKTGLTANTVGDYPIVTTEIFEGDVGKYSVIVTVRDNTSTGVGSYNFIITSEGKVTGNVTHTDRWELNRRRYNINIFGDEYMNSSVFASYSNESTPRKRGTNVFWAGEAFILNAEAAGNPIKVECQIKGTSYKTIMTNTGRKNALNEWLYKGELWHKDFLSNWGHKKPKEICFEFKAYYPGNIIKENEVSVIVDETDSYSKLHRLM